MFHIIVGVRYDCINENIIKRYNDPLYGTCGRKMIMNKREILLLQEAERKRIAEELHDTTVQNMICLSQQLELILLYMDRDVVQARLELAVARKHVKHMISGVRDTIYDLRPMIMDDIGWISAFDRLKDQLSYDNFSRNVHFDIDMIDSSDGITAISIYRIVCEGCQNIIKHSGADNIEVSVKNAGNFIKIRIRDDGNGIAEDEKNYYVNHFGLQFMNERVKALSGKMKIISDSTGTLIKISIPVERKD